MHVATTKQLRNLPNDEFDIWVKSLNAAHTINDVLDGWGNLSDAQCKQHADRLRALADRIDGRKTAGGNENTYSCC